MDTFAGESEEAGIDPAALTNSESSACVSSGDALIPFEGGETGELASVNGLANSDGCLQDDISKPFCSAPPSESPPPSQIPGTKETFERQFSEESINSERLNEFRTQLHRLSRQKDGLMPKPDGTFPSDWLVLAWEYQTLAEHVIQSAWPYCYPEGLLPCVSQQLEYLKRRLEEFPTIPPPGKDKFQRLYILAALGIIAKMKLVTFCWTYVELKQNEHRAGGRGVTLFLSHMRQSPYKGRGRTQALSLSVGNAPTPTALLDDVERTEYTTRSGRKTHRTAMKPEKI